jgi:hypothetical protein
MIDLKAINLRLANKKFLGGPAEESFFSHLVMSIHGLARPGEKLDVPEFNGQDAWARAYALYEALQRRQPTPEAQQAAADGRTMAQISRLQGELAADRAALKAFRDANRMMWSDLAEYVGIGDADLEPSDVDPQLGEANWREKHVKVGGALARLQGLSAQERRDVPRIVEERRRREFLRDLDRRIERLEQAQDLIAEELNRLGKAIGAMQPREAA